MPRRVLLISLALLGVLLGAAFMTPDRWTVRESRLVPTSSAAVWSLVARPESWGSWAALCTEVSSCAVVVDAADPATVRWTDGDAPGALRVVPDPATGRVALAGDLDGWSTTGGITVRALVDAGAGSGGSAGAVAAPNPAGSSDPSNPAGSTASPGSAKSAIAPISAPDRTEVTIELEGELGWDPLLRLIRPMLQRELHASAAAALARIAAAAEQADAWRAAEDPHRDAPVGTFVHTPEPSAEATPAASPAPPGAPSL